VGSKARNALPARPALGDDHDRQRGQHGHLEGQPDEPGPQRRRDTQNRERFGVILIGVLAAAGYFALRRSRYLSTAATAAAVLLVVDAWFDVITTPTDGRLPSILLAAAPELPLASVCKWPSYHAAAVTSGPIAERSCRSLIWRCLCGIARLSREAYIRTAPDAGGTHRAPEVGSMFWYARAADARAGSLAGARRIPRGP
jgi:hypothetical protein